MKWIVGGVLVVVAAVLAWSFYATPVDAPVTEPDTDATGALHERVVVSAPEPNQPVFKNFTVTGEAPGNWFFEASFPIRLVDAEGNTLAVVVATALSDWMTTEQVPFKAEVDAGEYSGPATLVLMRDNPSGLPEHDDSLEIPIMIQATE